MARNRYAEEQARKKDLKRREAELVHMEAEKKLRLAAAVRIQCALRCLFARRAFERRNKPLTSAEILEQRRRIFMAERRASRQPGYGVSMLRSRQVETHRQQVLSAREMRTETERWRAEDVRSAAMRMVREEAQMIRLRERSAVTLAHASRRSRISKEVLEEAREAAKKSFEAMQELKA